MARAIDTITVGALKQMLQNYDDNDLIAVSNKSGDYWRTQLASGIDSIETNVIEYSGYHNQFKIKEFDPEEDDEDDTEEHDQEQSVVLINLNQIY